MIARGIRTDQMWWSMIVSENRLPFRIKSGQAFSESRL
jgi:hypothetical protein